MASIFCLFNIAEMGNSITEQTSKNNVFVVRDAVHRPPRLTKRSATQLVCLQDSSMDKAMVLPITATATQSVSLSTTTDDRAQINEPNKLLSQAETRRSQRASLKRKVKKSQRKEKRATKTLGIVVGKLRTVSKPPSQTLIRFFSDLLATFLYIEHFERHLPGI